MTDIEWDEEIERQTTQGAVWNTPSINDPLDSLAVATMVSAAMEHDDGYFTTEVLKRSIKMTNADFERDVMLFEAQLNSVPRPDRNQIIGEIKQWNFATPSQDCGDTNRVYATYARLISYRHRLGELMALTQGYYELVIEAHKSLKEMAMDLVSGTEVVRKANAGYRVRPFEQEALRVAGIRTYLLETGKTLDMMTMHLASALKHLDAISRVSPNWERQGRSVAYDALQEEDSETSSAPIPGVRSTPRAMKRTYDS